MNVGEGLLAAWLDGRRAQAILAAAGDGGANALRVSLDLGRTWVEAEVERDEWRAEGRRFPVAPLAELARHPRTVFRAVSGGRDWEPVRAYGDRFYQLVATDEAPTIEIDGVQMHRTKGIGPFGAAAQFVRAVVRPGDRVLDTCGGLGYTALHALEMGAARVASYEISEEVLDLRQNNPWSRAGDAVAETLSLTRGDVFRALARAAPGEFHAVVHDPPRPSFAPELYSGAFYLRLHSALAPGGRLFHYTGAPYARRRGDSFVRNVVDELTRVGFSVELRADLQGVVAVRRAARNSPGDRR